MTFCVFLHWFTFKIGRSFVFILSDIIDLLIFLESLFAGLMSRHFGLFSKFSFWSLREIKAWRFFMHSDIQSCCQSKVYLRYDLVRCLFPKCCPRVRGFHVFAILSCKRLLMLYVSSEVSYIFCWMNWFTQFPQRLKHRHALSKPNWPQITQNFQ